MEKVYLIERKDYYLSHYGVEHQIADGGMLPQIFTKYPLAVKAYDATIATICESRNIDKSTIEHPNIKEDPRVLLCSEITITEKTPRTTVTLYEIDII